MNYYEIKLCVELESTWLYIASDSNLDVKWLHWNPHENGKAEISRLLYMNEISITEKHIKMYFEWANVRQLRDLNNNHWMFECSSNLRIMAIVIQNGNELRGKKKPENNNTRVENVKTRIHECRCCEKNAYRHVGHRDQELKRQSMKKRRENTRRKRAQRREKHCEK